MRVLMARSTWGVQRSQWEELFDASKAKGYGESRIYMIMS